INISIDKIKKLTNIDIQSLPPEALDANLYPNSLQAITSLKNTMYLARNLELEQEKKETINGAILRRYTNFTDYTTKMIDSILQRKKGRVHFDNVTLPDEVITEPQEIKETTKKHFQCWTKHITLDEPEWEKWEQEYQPIDAIPDNIYADICTTITEEEISNIIKNSPLSKATGPSLISNEMLRHLPQNGIKVLAKIFNAIFTIELIPTMWGNSLIWPIAKKTEYNGDLTQTRPITLIEHSRKIFTKIMTNRLNLIFTKHHILSYANNVAIPLTSTSQPIQQLSHIIEHAQIYKKELWIMSQDMSKAYDTVHLPLLEKALLRIKVPAKFTNVIMNIFRNRHNQVITTLGRTDSYTVEDGIDQGETISPILWRIYYDPLIRKINDTFLGYTMDTQIPLQSTKVLSVSTSVLAYMDDTTWIAPSCNELEKILTTASSFYKMSNLKI